MKLAVGLALVLAAVAAPAHAATAPELARTLGRQGIVDIDPGSGRPRVVARLDGYLTGPSRAAPERIALDYLRAHADVFGLDGDDLDGVRLTGSYLSRGRVNHLTFEQRAGNVPVLDGRLVANVAVDGRLLNLLGAPRPDVRDPGAPALAAPAARKRAAAAAGGSAGEPELVLLDGRLGWRALVETAGGEARELIVDAGDGRTLQDRSLRHDAKARIFDTAPGRALGGTQRSVELGGYVTQPGGAQLHGPYASVWADEDDDDRVDAGEDIPPSSGSDYEFTYTPFQTVAGVTCGAPAFCSWDRNQAFSWRTNRNEAAVNVFWHANRFHDHLANAAIDFTPAKGAFEGADAVLINVADGAALAAGLPDADHRNNAYNQTLPTGPARLTFLLDTTHSLNFADDAATIYHEYAHGLSQRLMLGALEGQQSDSLGEAWSDWYAVDYLSRSGFAPDTAAPGELTVGSLGRSQPIDCPVGAAAPACPGTAAAGPGGYTYGDFGKIESDGPEPHADGEIWAETLWDLRRRLIARYGSPLGIDVAEVLVTGGMELAPGDPTFLDMRNAIVEADVAFNGRDDGDLVWSAFAARGMGFFAAAIDSRDVRPVEDFSLLPPDTTATGDLTGRVLTEAGLPVPGARVTVAGLRGYAGATANAEGRWTIDTLAVGLYPRVYARAGAGLDTGVAADVRVSAGATTARDIVLRRDWAAYAGGARVTAATGNDDDGSRCGPSTAIDQDAGTTWITDAPAAVPGAKALTIALPEAVDVSTFEIDPSPGCGVGYTAMLAGWRLEVSRDGQTFTPVASGAFARPDAFRRNVVAPAAGSGYGVRFVRLVGLSSLDSSNPEFTGAKWLAVTDFAVYGSRADLSAPETSITTGPAALTSARDAAFAVSASEPGASFECRLDGAAFAACAALTAYAELGDGRHAFEVRAVDAAGNVDPSPAERAWTIDTSAPETLIAGSPEDGATTAERTAALSFISEPGARLECRLDGGTWEPCTSPRTWSGLADGEHAVEVRAIDAAGNADPTPARRAWRVVTVAAARVGFRIATQRLRAVASRGLRVAYTCPAACRLTWKLSLSASEARRLGLGRRAPVLARATSRRTTAGGGTAVLRLSPRAARGFKRATRATVRLEVSGAAPERTTLVLRR